MSRPVTVLMFAIAALSACDAAERAGDDDVTAVADATAPATDPIDTQVADSAPLEVDVDDDSAPACVAVAAQDPSCDGVDDDCDGESDEDFAPTLVACGDDACSPMGESRCDGGALGDTCTPRPAESDTTCDGVDDDCSGQSDEDWIVTPTHCGAGVCARDGELRCVGGATRDTCVAGAAAASDASCDDVDDDCDGVTDDDYLPVVATCGLGACAASGVTRCEAGHVRDDCVAGEPLADHDTSCNGIDDDCDGSDDDDYLPVPSDCGEGVCAGSGLTACVDGAVDFGCGTAEPKDADCDGVDDDCDGSDDDDYVARVTRCGTGACASTGLSACVGGEEHDDCVASQPAMSDTSCDGVDDDCSGQTDEDYVVVATTCGKGPCERHGEARCVGGHVVDTCVVAVGAPDDRTCDGFDDDCSGDSDEDYVAGTSSCGVGACATSGTTACGAGGERDVCTPLPPDCGGAQCGSDGCGGSCGSCSPSGLVCLAVSCGVDRQCHGAVVANRCFIDGACWTPGQADPSGSCGVCDPARAASAWSVSPNLAACDDHDATTAADTCWLGACRGFEQRQEPVLANSPLDWYDMAGPSPLAPLGPGVVALARTPTAAQAYFIHVSTWGAAMQGVSKSLGVQYFPVRATPMARGIFVEENRLWEWVDGDWVSSADAGSLRAAWPEPGSTFARFDHLLRQEIGSVPHVWGSGRSANSADLIVRHCVGPTWTCSNEVVRGDTINGAWTAGLVDFGGEVVLVVNDKASAPTKHRVVRKSGEPASWGIDATLNRVANGRLMASAEVARGTSAPWIVGTLSGAGLVVTQLQAWTDISVAGLTPLPVWDDIRTWQGQVAVLGRQTIGAETVSLLVYADVDASLADAASWRWRRLVSSLDRRRVDAMATDAEHLYLLGSAPDATTERRTMWRLETARGPAPRFTERFDTLDTATWKSLAQGSVSAPNWHLDDHAVIETGNHYDAETDASVVAKLGSVLWAPTVTWGAGRLTVAVRPSDDDGWGVQYGMGDATHYYRVSFDRQRGFARLVRVDGATIVTLAEDLAFVSALEHWHLLEVERAGAHHSVRLDGATVLQSDDATYPSGAIGLYAWNMSAAQFDDVRVYDP